MYGDQELSVDCLVMKEMRQVVEHVKAHPGTRTGEYCRKNGKFEDLIKRYRVYSAFTLAFQRGLLRREGKRTQYRYFPVEGR